MSGGPTVATEAATDLFERLTPWAALPLAPAIRDARASLARAVGDLLAVPDTALDTPWTWRDREVELRYAFYRCYEELEAAAAHAAAAVAVAGTVPGETLPAQPLLAPMTAARWDLQGLLAPLTDEDLDRDPGGGEWTLRQTLAHVIESQRAYSWFGAWWLARRDAEDYPEFVPDDVVKELPGEQVEGAEGAGTLAEVRERLDGVVDRTSERLGTLDADDLVVRSRWSGYPVPISFRLARGSSHLREHTVQVEKTLAMLGRQPTEVERLVRLVCGAYGRLEEGVFGVAPAELDHLGPDGRSASVVVRDALETVAGHAADVAAGTRGTTPPP